MTAAFFYDLDAGYQLKRPPPQNRARGVDYTRHKVQYADYPGIVPWSVFAEEHNREACSVRGTLVTGLSESNIEFLDIFEGSEYRRQKVPVHPLDDLVPLLEYEMPLSTSVSPLPEELRAAVEVDTYVYLNPRGLLPDIWSWEVFVEQHASQWYGDQDGSSDEEVDSGLTETRALPVRPPGPIPPLPAALQTVLSLEQVRRVQAWNEQKLSTVVFYHNPASHMSTKHLKIMQNFVDGQLHAPYCLSTRVQLAIDERLPTPETFRTLLYMLGAVSFNVFLQQQVPVRDEFQLIHKLEQDATLRVPIVVWVPPKTVRGYKTAHADPKVIPGLRLGIEPPLPHSSQMKTAMEEGDVLPDETRVWVGIRATANAMRVILNGRNKLLGLTTVKKVQSVEKALKATPKKREPYMSRKRKMQERNAMLRDVVRSNVHDFS
uniref:Putative gamma-glutamylcyclotransferase n=1 Tax=Mycena chlorophos TaxID=658473 RepID=A0ABQ0MES0_MYCCL|nr:predicted protein [Mycena chlorophos]